MTAHRFRLVPSLRLALLLGIISPALLIASLMTSGTLRAQISISPKRILLSAHERSSELIISNSGPVPFEVTAEISDRRLQSDSTGREWYDTTATPDEILHSCQRWVKVFPKRFILPPNSTRKIRILAAPTGELADGEYVGRLMLASVRAETQRLDSVDTNKIAVDLRFRMNMILQVVYRKGEVNTGVRIDDAAAMRFDSGAYVVVGVSWFGNAAYRGVLSSVVRTEDGRKLDSVMTPYILEFSKLYQRLRLPDVPDGRYELTLESRAELPGSASELVLPSPLVRSTYTLVFDKANIVLTRKDF